MMPPPALTQQATRVGENYSRAMRVKPLIQSNFCRQNAQSERLRCGVKLPE